LNSLAPQTTFAITTNGGNDFAVATPSVTLSGNGWINVDEIRLTASGQSLPITWTSQSQWQVTVPLQVVGQNPISLTAYDTHGTAVGSDTITVTTSTAVAQPKDSLRISEIMYHPAPDGNEQYEFIELTNIGATTLDLAGVKFDTGIHFTFAAGTSLAPGAFIVVVKDEAAFASRYGSGINVAGNYGTDNLSNSGEELRLVDALGQTILDFTFDDDWYKTTDGNGPSLVIVNPTASTTAWGQQSGWRASTQTNGSPGAADPLYVDGDYNKNGTVDAADYAVWRATLGNSVTAHSGADGDGDGIIDNDDYNVWRAHFGQVGPAFASGSGSGASSSLAEPNEFAARASAAGLSVNPVADESQPNQESETASRPVVEPPIATAATNKPAPRRSQTAASALFATHPDDALLAWLASHAAAEAPAGHDLGPLRAWDDADLRHEDAKHFENHVAEHADEAFARLSGRQFPSL
jgi:hypothetical protein